MSSTWDIVEGGSPSAWDVVEGGPPGTGRRPRHDDVRFLIDLGSSPLRGRTFPWGRWLTVVRPRETELPRDPGAPVRRRGAGLSDRPTFYGTTNETYPTSKGISPRSRYPPPGPISPSRANAGPTRWDWDLSPGVLRGPLSTREETTPEDGPFGRGWVLRI